MSKKPQEVNPQSTTAAPAVYEGPTGLADNITSQDLRLPRIALLQALSPQVQQSPETYKQGMFIDTLTQDIIPAPITITPVFIFKNVIKWKPRAEGGGMLWKTLHPTAEQLKEAQWDGANKPAADMYINAVCTVDGMVTPLLISFCKTSLKTGQDLVTLVTLSGCAWKYKYSLESVKQTNTKGTFYVMRVKRVSGTSPEEAASAAELFDQVKNMAIETDYEGATQEASVELSTPKEF